MSTFGNESTTNDENWYDLNYKIATKFTLSEAADITKLTAYVKSGSGTAYGRLFIYDDDGAAGIPGTLMGATPEGSLTDSSLVWKDFTFAAPVELTAGNWWLGGHIGANFHIAVNTATGTGRYTGADTYEGGTEASWTDNDAYTCNVCIYATYGAGVPEGPTITAEQSGSDIVVSWT